MRIRFWGTRGSIAKPGSATLRYGGNTSCVEVRSARGTLIVLDGGTGAHALGQALRRQPGPRRGHLLITHTHWDHIQGLPFFEPFFEPGDEWHVFGPRGFGMSLRETLAGQMQYSYFPVPIEKFAAQVHYHELVEGTFEVEEVRISARFLNHPALTLGYRLEADGVTLVYATDHEPHTRPAAAGSPLPPSSEGARHARFVAGADLLIHDAQYTADEYPKRVGWGHSPVDFVVDTARETGVRRLALFHHDPLRDDDQLDQIVRQARARAGEELEVFAAAEGGTLELASASGAPARATRSAPSARVQPTPSTAGQTLLLATPDAGSADILSEAALAEGFRLLRASDPDALLDVAKSEHPALVILQRRLAGRDALELCRRVRGAQPSELDDPPIIVLAEDQHDVDLAGGGAAGVTDWLVPPFKTTYARARMRCWLLRTACRWAKAPAPDDEEQRIRALRGLGVLDTAPEERFDRHTRVAAALFDVPIALVSLVDRDRQWFKSHHGLDEPETPREMAFCAHAILAPEALIVQDALRDPRFADNPLVTGPPHVRFYAGVPLSVADDRRVGTLCLIDHCPRQLDSAQLELLRDLARMVERELQLPLA